MNELNEVTQELERGMYSMYGEIQANLINGVFTQRRARRERKKVDRFFKKQFKILNGVIKSVEPKQEAGKSKLQLLTIKISKLCQKLV